MIWCLLRVTQSYDFKSIYMPRTLKCISLAHTFLPNSRYISLNFPFIFYIIFMPTPNSFDGNTNHSASWPQNKQSPFLILYFKKIATHIQTLRESCWMYLKYFQNPTFLTSTVNTVVFITIVSLLDYDSSFPAAPLLSIAQSQNTFQRDPLKM